MDNVETVSNASDCLSNLSSLSGLTGYEDELYDLKHLTQAHSNTPRQVNKNNSDDHNQFDAFEERIRTLNAQLQNALKSNEKYKNDMYNLERKTELAFHEKFERLMRHNAQLEGQLGVANDRIRNLLNKNGECVRALELVQLQKQINLLQNEVARWKNEAELNDVSNNRLKLEIEEMKIDVCTKNNSVVGLKSKIVDLHVEMQTLTQDNVKVNNSLLVISNELDSCKKSESWYKEQLQQCRSQKAQASGETSQLRSLLAGKERDLDARNSDLSRLKDRYEDLRLSSLQDNENFLKAMDKLQLKTCNNNLVDDHGSLEMYESTIQSLTRELATIKAAVNDQQSSFDDLNKRNSQLVAQNTTLLKISNEKEIYLANLESEKRDLNVKLELAHERLKENERLLMVVVNEKSEVEVALNGANREKREIEDAVKLIRGNFSKFAYKYNTIQNELQEKEQLVLALRNERLIINNHIDQLSVDNRKLNELNKTLQTQVEESSRIVEQLRSELERHRNTSLGQQQQFEAFKRSVIAEKDSVINQLRNEISLDVEIKSERENELQLRAKIIAGLSEELEALQKKTVTIKNAESELRLYQQNKEGEIVLYQKTATDLKEELWTLRENMATLRNSLQLKEEEVRGLKENVNNLSTDIAVRDQRLNVFQETLQQLKSESCDFDKLNKSLQNENSELKEKLAKFVMNNFNGYNKTVKDKQSEWLVCVLEWLSSSLREINNRTGVTRDLKEFLSNCSGLACNSEVEKALMEISVLFTTVSSAMTAQAQANKQSKLKLFSIQNKLVQLEDKHSLLQKRCSTDDEAIGELKQLITENRIHQQSVINEEIKNLRTLCKAKELENKERQKRYEVNNRTLLKKVKEHMRGRNSAEKRCNYLQELYNSVFDEFNSIKLQETAKDAQIQSLQNMCDNYKNINTKMKQDLLHLEKQRTMVESKCAVLGAKLNMYENEIQSYVKQLNEKEILQEEAQATSLANASLQKEHKTLVNQVQELTDALKATKQKTLKLEEMLEKERAKLRELYDELAEEQKQRSVCAMQLENAQQSLGQIEEKSKLMSEEIEILNSKLQQGNVELDNLQAQKKLIEDGQKQKETHVQSLITNLQTEIQTLQNDLVSVRSEKYFLQRLCSDLKLALQTYMNQSKVLKQHIQTLSSESKDYTSLPNPVMNLPSPSKYDDAYINQLLKQSNAPPTEKPLGDLENSLNSLKKELVCLRKQVTEKAGYHV